MDLLEGKRPRCTYFFLYKVYSISIIDLVLLIPISLVLPNEYKSFRTFVKTFFGRITNLESIFSIYDFEMYTWAVSPGGIACKE